MYQVRKIKRVLISVSDKEGIVEFARNLTDLGIQIISTGGTAKLLRENGISVKQVEEVTGFPEILDGRVKTLHPKIHCALLSIHDKEEHKRQLEEYGIEPVDMLVVNLYPFKETISRGCSQQEAIENIDVGGPAMLRAGSKNFQDVVVVTSPGQYPEVLKELKESGNISMEKRKRLAVEAFKLTSNYDSLIHNYLTEKEEFPSILTEKEEFPSILSLKYEHLKRLRYGENPHQEGVLYKELMQEGYNITKARQIHGKELSFNNILDLDAALSIVREFQGPTVAIIKHTNPSGVASADSLVDAYRRAYLCDPDSAFGSIIALNRTVDKETAEEMGKLFIEAIIAPSFEPAALEILKQKKNLRILEMNMSEIPADKIDFRKISGGILVQTPNSAPLTDPNVVTEKEPSDEELKSLMFAWNVVKHVKSNAIVLAKDEHTVGIGAGQMSRIDSVKVAIWKADENSSGSVMASDAFFPFRDSIDEAAKAGIKAIIQPGGSIRDEECIQAANEHGIAMIFTGVRCFKH